MVGLRSISWDPCAIAMAFAPILFLAILVCDLSRPSRGSSSTVVAGRSRATIGPLFRAWVGLLPLVFFLRCWGSPNVLGALCISPAGILWSRAAMFYWALVAVTVVSISGKGGEGTGPWLGAYLWVLLVCYLTLGVIGSATSVIVLAEVIFLSSLGIVVTLAGDSSKAGSTLFWALSIWVLASAASLMGVFFAFWAGLTVLPGSGPMVKALLGVFFLFAWSLKLALPPACWWLPDLYSGLGIRLLYVYTLAYQVPSFFAWVTAASWYWGGWAISPALASVAVIMGLVSLASVVFGSPRTVASTLAWSSAFNLAIVVLALV